MARCLKVVSTWECPRCKHFNQSDAGNIEVACEKCECYLLLSLDMVLVYEDETDQL